MTELERQRQLFRIEVSGQRGEFWKKDALNRLWRCIEDIESGKAIIESDGAVKWKTNGNYIMDDLIVVFEQASSRVNAENNRKKRDIQVSKQIEEYRRIMKNHEYTEEEKREMDNAFGPGHTIVDIFTGRKYVTR